MAETLKKIEDQLCCLVCLDTYTNPKQLLCNHIYCRSCLTRLVVRNPLGQLYLSCPACRQVTPLQENGVAGLRSAFQISKFVEILKNHKENVPYCNVHHGRELELYCKTCEKLICAHCTIKSHHHHCYILASEVHMKENLLTAKALRSPTLTIGRVRKPYGVAISRRGEVVVTEWAGHRVSVFNPYGEKLVSFGTYGSGQGQFRYPCGVAIDNEGNILVTDHANHRIQKFTGEGQFVTAVGTEGNTPLHFHYPIGIAVNATNNKVYVVDGWNERVQILNSDLTFSSTFGKSGSSKGCFKYPQGIACDCTGRVYVSDGENQHIQVFTAQGKIVRRFGKRGVSNGELKYPAGVAVDSSNVYVSEHDNNRISVFTCEGHFVTSFGRKGKEPGEFLACCGVAVDHSGVLYVCDRENNNIQVYLKLKF